MKLSKPKKAATPWDRLDELRKRRVAAETLRAICPDAASVRVELEFRDGARPVHTPQSYSLFPPAKAHFIYPCPYGDCAGLYDLQAVAVEALRVKRKNTRGTLTCTGTRSRVGGGLCELQLNYSISLDCQPVSRSSTKGAL